MTVINRLIKEAKSGATELLLPENHIGSMAQHMVSHGWEGVPFPETESMRDCAERWLRMGVIQLLGVPVRVIPKRTP